MRSTAYTSTYALSTQMIWSSVVLSAVLMDGIATLTIVVSSMIMKNPEVRTSRTSHGLVRARAMSPPQSNQVGMASDLPLQLSFVDLSFEIDDPPAFGLEHGDLVLELDEGQAGHAHFAHLGHDSVELFDLRLQRDRAIGQVPSRLRRAEVVHEHQARGEVRVLAPGVGEDVADHPDQDIPAWLRELVDGSLGTPALPLALGGDDPAAALEDIDRVVQRAEVEADELVLVAVAHRRRELIRMHRALVQQLQDRERQRRHINLRSGHIPFRIYRN